MAAGLHVQYRLVNPQVDRGVATKALRWIGIDLTGGVELTRWSLGIDDQIVTEFGVDGTNGDASLIHDSTGTFDLTSTTATLPVELSTGVRIALLLSMYVGVAVDLNVGKGKLNTNLTGPLLTTQGQSVGTTTITGGGGEETASPLAARILAGLQLNLWKLKLYAQVNASATPAASVGFGIRGVL